MHSISVPKELICGLVNHRTIHLLCKLSAESRSRISPSNNLFFVPQNSRNSKNSRIGNKQTRTKNLHTLQRIGDVNVSCQTKVHPESQLFIQFNIHLSSTVEFLWCLRRWIIFLQCGRPGLDPWARKIPWRREWLPTPTFLPGEFQEPGGLQSMGSKMWWFSR